MGIAAAIVGAVLVAFAIVLINQQSGDRDDIEKNFSDRAKVSAALTQSLFEASSTIGQAQNARRFGSESVSAQTMAKAQQQNQSQYLVLLDPKGEVISASPSTPPDVLLAVTRTPTYVKTVLGGANYGLSNLIPLNGSPQGGFALAAPVDTDFGRRVLVSGSSAQLLSVFLGSYLQRVPNVAGGAAFLFDGNGATIAGTEPGQAPSDIGLTEAASSGAQGSFGGGQYFASAPIEGSPWKVVSTAPESSLFDSVTGAHKWVPWLIFALLAIAAMASLVLLSRVLRSSTQIADANDRLEDANVALERRAEELGRSNSELEQFASIASHDLKEPLRKVQTLTELLERKEAETMTAEGRDYLTRTSTAAGRMQALIDDLLKFSRVATQGRPFEEVDLGTVAQQAVSDLEGVIESEGGSVEVGELPTVAADPLQMRQLLQNLISNALKFHREGVPAEVKLSGRTRGRFAEIEVADNGIGFEPRYKARIFRVFERLHGRGTYEGTGIGLALCRKIVDRHGGTITAESTPGKGSTFTVTLPIEQLADSALPVNGDGRPADRPYAHA